MRVLVTGGAGFIGSHVVEALLKRGDQVVVVDNLSHGVRAFVPPGVMFIEKDILAWRDWVDGVETVDAVIHLAAQISVPVSLDMPDEDVRLNVLGTVAMLQASRALSAREFRLASSAAVYGDNPRLPLDEGDAGQPLSYYGLDKWIAESYVHYEERMHGLKGVVLRLANVYGPRQRTQGEGGVVAMFSEALARGQRPTMFGDGQQTRDFIAVEDIAAAFLHRLGLAEPGGLYNIGTEQAVTIRTIWEILADASGVSADDLVRAPDRPGDIRHSRLRVGRATAWGFQPQVPLTGGLQRTLRYFQETSPRE